jgi:CBS domain-containing protein
MSKREESSRDAPAAGNVGVMEAPIHTIMTSEVQTVRTTTPLEQAIRILLEHGISGMPVVDDTGVVGVVTLTDMAKRFRGEAPDGTIFYSKDEIAALVETLSEGAPLEGTVGEVMSTKLIAVDPDSTIREASRRMVADRIHRVLVIDGAKKLVGIVSTLDVVDHLSR